MSSAVPLAIEVAGLNKSFASRRAVCDLSFAVTPGEIFGLVGPDGAGKTTTMRMLAGVMRPDNGSIVIDDIDVIAEPDIAKQHLSYMPQRFGLYEDLTVDENIRFYADLFSIPRAMRKERAKRLLEASGMTAFRGRLAGQLSGGMKQKLGLTCSLIHTPKILLLDEPTTGVDPVSRRDFWRILYDLREGGVTIVISTAYLDEAERCHRLALLNQGRLLHCDTPAALKARMKGELLSIATPDPRAAQDAVRDARGVTSTMLMGDAVHVVVDNAESRMPELRAALSAAGVAFESMAAIPPTIEDLFVTLDDSAVDG
ncbi:MAG: ATP-binding cassette domain-containing protein [Rhizomicrobium sp.]